MHTHTHTRACKLFVQSARVVEQKRRRRRRALIDWMSSGVQRSGSDITGTDIDTDTDNEDAEVDIIGGISDASSSSSNSSSDVDVEDASDTKSTSQYTAHTLKRSMASMLDGGTLHGWPAAAAVDATDLDGLRAALEPEGVRFAEDGPFGAAAAAAAADDDDDDDEALCIRQFYDDMIANRAAAEAAAYDATMDAWVRDFTAEYHETSASARSPMEIDSSDDSE